MHETKATARKARKLGDIRALSLLAANLVHRHTASLKSITHRWRTLHCLVCGSDVGALCHEHVCTVSIIFEFSYSMSREICKSRTVARQPHLSKCPTTSTLMLRKDSSHTVLINGRFYMKRADKLARIPLSSRVSLLQCRDCSQTGCFLLDPLTWTHSWPNSN